jgi:hypothetical protein
MSWNKTLERKMEMKLDVRCATLAVTLSPRAVRLLINTPRARGTIECRMLQTVSVGKTWRCVSWLAISFRKITTPILLT